MLKTLMALARGRAAGAAERLADGNALAILDQQMREATVGYERARKALALAQAQAEREEARIAGVVAQIADLEIRVGAALDEGRSGWRGRGRRPLPRWRPIAMRRARRKRASPPRRRDCAAR